MIYNVKLVVADIDLTLRSSNADLPALNKKALEDLHKNGILFGLASGRSVSQMRNLWDMWNLNFNPDLLIAINGSALYDKIEDKTYEYFYLEKEWVEELLDEFDANNLNYYAYVGDNAVFKAECDHYVHLSQEINRKVFIAKSKDDFKNDTVYKFLFNLTYGEEEIEKISLILKPLLDKHKDDYKLLLTTSTCLEVVNAKTSKAFGLDNFCNINNIPLSDVVAFGDADNDNEMLIISGTGVCLADGVENTKKIADYVTDLNCDDGGVGDFIYKHILKTK